VFVERTSVGLDVHARSVVASALDTITGEVVEARLIPKNEIVTDWVRQLPGPWAVAYEAGPTGYSLARHLASVGIRCEVAAPSKLQRPSGDRVKTDLRDARHLGKLLRLDEIVAVRVPSLEQEQARDLVRAREDARQDLMRARQRLSKLLLRHGHIYSGGNAWTLKHDAWLRSVRFTDPIGAITFDSDYDAVLSVTARRNRLDDAIEAMASNSVYTPVVTRLGCLRGISTLTGFALAVEIGDWDRFTGRSIGAYVGLVPTESSSGEHTARGPITKAGNGHARRLLVEAAWHHRKPYRPGAALRRRWDAAPAAARARGDAGNRRLLRRWAAFDARSKKPTVACVAIARELAGWTWSLATLDPDT
jgi:transposase